MILEYTKETSVYEVGAYVNVVDGETIIKDLIKGKKIKVKDNNDDTRKTSMPKTNSSNKRSKNIGINILSLTDKIDHLAGFFSIDKKPSGSNE